MDQRKSIEWYDRQKKPNSSFRELLRNNLDKTNPRRKERTRDEATKLAKLETIAAKLRCGENLQNRQLKIWLSDDEYAAIDPERTDFSPIRPQPPLPNQ